MESKKSLSSYVTVRIAIVLVVVFFASSILTYIVFKGRLTVHMQNEVALKAEQASGRIQNIFENAKIYTTQMGKHPQLIAYLKAVKSREDVYKEPFFSETLTILKAYQSSSNTHFLAWVANVAGNFYLDSTGTVPDMAYEVKERPWYAVAASSKDVEFTEPYIEYGTGRTVLSSIQALRESEDQIFGFVVIDVVLETLPEILGDVRISNRDINFLITAEGQYIYKSKLATSKSETIVEAGDPLAPYAQKMLKERSGFIEIDYQGEKRYLGFYPATDSGWLLLTIIDKAAVERESMNMAITLAVIFSVALVLIVSMTVYIVKRRLQPLGALTQVADDIAKGQFTKHLEPRFLQMPDEIGQMSRAFEKITAAFLKEHNTLEGKVHEMKLELATQYGHLLETEKMAALGNLVAGVAHEINTPLGVGLSVASYLDVSNKELREKLIEGKMTRSDLERYVNELNESIEMLNNNLNRAAELIKSFKQVAVDQSSDGLSQFNLKDNIDVVIMSLKHAYKHQNHQVLNTCPNFLIIDSYPGAYSQIFSNFIMNSVHHGFKEMANGEMTFSCEVRDSRLYISYRDNGRGISQENLKHIFEPFFTTNRQKGNTGLGMHIVYNLVTQKLKGNITCTSVLGEGVHFMIDVPIKLNEEGGQV